MNAAVTSTTSPNGRRYAVQCATCGHVVARNFRSRFDAQVVAAGHDQRYHGGGEVA